MPEETKEQNEDKMKEGWHLDKRVPLSIIVALFVQTGALIMWGTKLDSRVSTVEQKMSEQNIVIDTMKDAQNSISVGLARIEERQIIAGEVVKEIRARLDEVSKK